VVHRVFAQGRLIGGAGALTPARHTRALTPG
jgi:hypothetical protein